MNVGEKIWVNGNGWALERADRGVVEFVWRADNCRKNGIGLVVGNGGVSCTDWDDVEGGSVSAPIEVVEAAIRIWRELQTG